MEIDHGIAFDDAEPRPPLPFECYDFHFLVLSTKFQHLEKRSDL